MSDIDSTSTTSNQNPQRARRGFAAMPREQQRNIASLGGRAAHASGHAHEFNSEEARLAGRKRHEKAAARLRPE
jgi:uncharacterized protein